MTKSIEADGYGEDPSFAGITIRHWSCQFKRSEQTIACGKINTPYCLECAFFYYKHEEPEILKRSEYKWESF